MIHYLKLKQREVDLKAMDAERKMKEDRSKNQNLIELKWYKQKILTIQKLEQNEDLAQFKS